MDHKLEPNGADVIGAHNIAYIKDYEINPGAYYRSPTQNIETAYKKAIASPFEH